jgi:hypothetical protein
MATTILIILPCGFNYTMKLFVQLIFNPYTLLILLHTSFNLQRIIFSAFWTMRNVIEGYWQSTDHLIIHFYRILLSYFNYDDSHITVICE